MTTVTEPVKTLTNVPKPEKAPMFAPSLPEKVPTFAPMPEKAPVEREAVPVRRR